MDNKFFFSINLFYLLDKNNFIQKQKIDFKTLSTIHLKSGDPARYINRPNTSLVKIFVGNMISYH